MQNPVSHFTTYGAAPFFVFCDHASNHIPVDLNDLGMPEDLLETHIAWDIGASAIAEAIAKRLGCALFQCAFSRLIIDPNRALTSNDLIPATSDQIPIPGNQMLNDAQRRARIEQFHMPYHDQLAAELNRARENTEKLFVISIHSFTNRLMGAAEDRPWPVGLLWREDERSARATIDFLSRETDWPIGDNQPYDAREFNYSVDRHVGPINISHLTMEFRQDYLSCDEEIEKMAELVAGGVRELVQ